jgi:hypothetical protein
VVKVRQVSGERRRRKLAGNQAEIEAYKAFAAHQQQTRGWHEQDTGFNQEVRLA